MTQTLVKDTVELVFLKNNGELKVDKNYHTEPEVKELLTEKLKKEAANYSGLSCLVYLKNDEREVGYLSADHSGNLDNVQLRAPYEESLLEKSQITYDVESDKFFLV